MSSSSKNKITWDLKPLLSSETKEKIDGTLKKAADENTKFIKRWKKRKDYTKDPKILKKALDEYEHLSANYGILGGIGYYFSLKLSLSQDDPKIKARVNKLSSRYDKMWNELAFFTHRISKIPQKNQKTLLNSPHLKEYKHFIERLFNEAIYLLSEKEEKIVTLKAKVSHGNWTKMLSEFLSKEEEEVVNKKGKLEKKSFTEIRDLWSNKNKKIRDSASKAFNSILLKHSDVAEHELNSVLENKKNDDELRKISRPDTTRHLSDDIDAEVVDTLLDCVVSDFNTPNKYYELKAKLFGVNKLEYHERNVEYGSIEENCEYDKAVEIVSKVFGNLDKEFLDVFVSLSSGGYIDVFPKKSKLMGAFCSHNLKTHPTYILLNHTNMLTNVGTLAHEMGHAINNELMKKNQNALNFGSPISIAEVASTFFEDLILEELGKQADKEIRLSILMQQMDGIVSAVYRQVGCYKFEQELHETFRKVGYLPKKDIGKLFKKHMSAYMGSFMKQSPGSENWWVYWSHIRNFFYNYSYASGLLISKALQGKVKKNPKFIKEIKWLLAVGGSMSPKNTLKQIGIDIASKEIWNEGLAEAHNVLDQAWNLAKELKKI